ncbi:hypothetical protein CDAR_525461 [Caerostris darwini]|uniref:Uncharacterized protein n=1 Tax=Caerostris darwini TaxID=1538125 RepID=A0AAV4RIQ3_9ARAC|nr:hypothetical protein CDAR_525461 [Caerostris darwini]
MGWVLTKVIEVTEELKVTEEHKFTRVRICQCALNDFNNEGDAFLSKIVTGSQGDGGQGMGNPLWTTIKTPEDGVETLWISN